MIISSKQVGEALKAQGERLRPNHEPAPPGVVPLRGSDRVTLSSRATEVSRLLQHLLREVPEVRSERVQELARAIAAGEYHVSAQDVAAKLVGWLLADRLE